jgi:hypothetical protein
VRFLEMNVCSVSRFPAMYLVVCFKVKELRVKTFEEAKCEGGRRKVTGVT